MRLEQLTLDILEPEQRDLYDTIVGSRTGSTLPGRVVDEDGNLQGPFNAMLHYPELGLPLQELGGVLRFRGLLSPRARELVILTVAASWESEFEWWAHVRIGKHIGLTDDEIDAVRTSGPLALDDPAEQSAVDVARAATTRGDLDDDEYARAQDALGDRMLIEVLTLVGYYSLLALQMRVHRVPLPEGAQPLVHRTEDIVMDAAEQLLAIEEIKQLKARYFRCMDTKDWDGFGQVFAPNAVLDVTGETGTDEGIVRGNDADRRVRARSCRSGHDRAPRAHARDRDHLTDHGHRHLVDGGHAALARRVRRSPRCTDTATTTRPTRRSTVSGGSRAASSPACASTPKRLRRSATLFRGGDHVVGHDLQVLPRELGGKATAQAGAASASRRSSRCRPPRRRCRCGARRAPRAARRRVRACDRLAMLSLSTFHSPYMRTSCIRYGPTSSHARSTSSATNTVVAVPGDASMHRPGSCPCLRASVSYASRQSVAVALGEEIDAVTPGAARRGLRAATPRNVDRRGRRRRDLHLTAFVLEGLSRHRLQQHAELLLGDGTALGSSRRRTARTPPAGSRAPARTTRVPCS